MSRSVDRPRWLLAQQGEARYWQAAQSTLSEQSRILDEKIQALELARKAVPGLNAYHGLKVEVGIGPMGIGALHFLSTGGALVGVDPLPPIRTSNGLSRPFKALIQSCWQNYLHVRARGEQLPIATGSVSIVACYNVLDHVESPHEVLMEIHRILRPDAYLLLGCDTVSFVSLLKFHLYAKWRARNSLAIICHPFHFLTSDLERLVAQSGFSVLWVRRRPTESLSRAMGHAFRSLYVLQKKALPGSNGSH